MLTSTGISAQELGNESEPINGAKMVFANAEYDFGIIHRGNDGLYAFEFENKGNEPLIISNVKSSCGCAIVRWPRTPVLPGEKGKIDVHYVSNRIGVFMKVITVYSNTVDRPSIILTIKGEIVKDDKKR